MARAAQQLAFGQFCHEFVDRACSAPGHFEFLCGWVDVIAVEQVRVVWIDSQAAAGALFLKQFPIGNNAFVTFAQSFC